MTAPRAAVPSAALLALAAVLAAGCRHSAPTPPPPAPERLAEGRRIAADAFATLSGNLLGALAKGGVPAALPFCHVQAGPLTEGLSARHHATVQRLSHRARNPANRAAGRDAAVLQEFAAQQQAGSAPANRVERDAAGRDVFYAPILIPMDTCLQCHGEPGRDITDANLALIRSLYPEDAATGFRLGQLRGLWKITFHDRP